jgi:hypothetical protein
MKIQEPVKNRILGGTEEISALRPHASSFPCESLPRQIKSEGPPWFSGCRSVLSLSPLHPFYRLLMFDPSTLALAQIVGMASERRLNISLIISTKSLDLPFKRITLRTGHPMLTSLASQKKALSQGPNSHDLGCIRVSARVSPASWICSFPRCCLPLGVFLCNTRREELQPLLTRREAVLVE